MAIVLHLGYRHWDDDITAENLGGNSRTVMLATISPASIHRDETLATLRYACQARSIVNRVKVNEDPNDRLIRELLAKIERLQVQQQNYERQRRLSEANLLQPRKIIIETSVDDGKVEALRQQLAETEQELAKAQRSWRERLQEAEDVRRTEMKLLKRKGLALELSAEQKEPCLVNLAADPMLSGTLLYLIPAGTVRIGRPSSLSSPDIMLEGPLVSPNHCTIENAHGKLFLMPESHTEYETFVNGELVQERRQLFHGDRLVIGGSHYFRVSNPLCPNKSNQQMIDFQLAHQEILNEQENRLRRELDAEKQAAIAQIEAERIANEQLYEERLATLELEKFKYECRQQILESEQEAAAVAPPRDARESLAGSDLSFPDSSNLADEIRRIMEHTSEESLAHIQMMVKEAGQRCRAVGLDYEFKQQQVWQEEGMFRAIIHIVDRTNGRVAEWLPARLEYWLTVVRDRDELTAGNMFDQFELHWTDPGTDPAANDSLHSLLHEPQRSSRISLNFNSVKDAILAAGRNSLLSSTALTGSSPGAASPSTQSTKTSQPGLLRSLLTPRGSLTSPAGAAGGGSARKALFIDTNENEENIPTNNRQQSSSSASKASHRFKVKTGNYLGNIEVALLKLQKHLERHQGEQGSAEQAEPDANEVLATRMLSTMDDVQRSFQNLRSIFTECNLQEATQAAIEEELRDGRPLKSVKFLLD
ncbi:kinesin-like protein KIF1B [Anopheles darlingi]|uniref:Kinesin-like protein KIF1B n=1 Tax=Anopheles darlingi TaxID=43151 RepID=W5JPU1_ANODA|nr:kinesin-like protein KIF1B [Anopheles darlingi]